MSTVTKKFAIGDDLFTGYKGKIIACIVQEINIHIPTGGDTVVTNTVTHDDSTLMFTDTVSFPTAAECGTYLVANVES